MGGETERQKLDGERKGDGNEIANVKQMFEKEPAKLLDANVIAAMLPMKETFTEKIQIF